MAYTMVRTVATITFEDMPGLHLRSRMMSVGEITDIPAMLAAIQEVAGDKSDSDDPEKVKMIKSMMMPLVELLAGNLVDWDLSEEDGTPVPATKDGLLSLEMPFFMAITKGWMSGITQAPGPLEVSLPDGEQSLMESIPMELSATSQVS